MARTPTEQAWWRRRPGRAHHGCWPDGPRRADGWAGADLGRAFGLGPVRWIVFLIF
jgi:hypothetical protein